MVRTLLLTSAIALTTLTMPATAQESSISDEQWREIRSFLETNPGITQQLKTLINRPDPAQQAQIDAQRVLENQAALLEGPDTPVLGNSLGKRIIVKFSDYSCGHCKSMHGTLANMIEQDDTLQVRIIEFPILGERSELAARFALAAKALGGNEAYAAAHDALFKAGSLSVTTLRTMAEDIGLDPTQTLATMLEDTITNQLKANLSLGETLGITGTPGLIAGTTIVRGSVPQSTMEQVLAQAYPPTTEPLQD